MDVVHKSLDAIIDLNYPSNRFELIVIDNGSNDGSFEVIRGFLDRKASINKKVVRLNKNLGFTGGNNIGYRVRDRESKYIALLNNDAIPFPDSLKNLVEYAESRKDVGATQGVIVDMNTGKVDTAGDILTELLAAYQLYHYKPPQSVKRNYYISYADGAYSLYKIDAIKKATGFSDKIFYDEMFAYFDDSILGLQLWNSGYKIVSCPLITALHRRSSSFGILSPSKLYLQTRGYITLNELCNSIYKKLIRNMFYLSIIRRLVTRLFSSKFLGNMYKLQSSALEAFSALYYGYLDGLRLGKVYRSKTILDIYKAPILRTRLGNGIIMLLTGIGIDFMRRSYTEKITKEFENQIHMFIAV
jgi:GT2 family glycosyltransferase